MSLTTNGVRTPKYEPDWARVPPHVATYPNPPAYFRSTPAEKYTCPEGKAECQKWWSKWHYESPEWKDEHYRLDSRFPVMRREQFQPGVTKPAFRSTGQVPEFRSEFYRQGSTVSEATRARALNRIHFARADPNLYQFSNAMTGTQYQKPVPDSYGPMLRKEVYGLKTMHNRHGFMPCDDYYF